MMNRESFVRAIQEIQRSLGSLAGNGYRGFDPSRQSLDKLEQWGQSPEICIESLIEIRTDLGDCQRCRLSRERKNIVFGAGNPKAKLVFVGEGPGFEEDRQGQPFVGPAGQLLTRIIEAMKLTRERVYICNIIKCRPPGNRNPAPDEIRTCFPFLERQIAAIQPEFICALGTFAAQTLLGTDIPISKLRRRFHEYRGIKVLPTYHPAYLLRNTDKKRDVWEDMKMLMKEDRYED
jgi:uracil-DNA glycosylase family 4